MGVVSQPAADAERTGARVYTAHRRWLGIVTGITAGVPVRIMNASKHSSGSADIHSRNPKPDIILR